MIICSPQFMPWQKFLCVMIIMCPVPVGHHPPPPLSLNMVSHHLIIVCVNVSCLLLYFTLTFTLNHVIIILLTHRLLSSCFKILHREIPIQHTVLLLCSDYKQFVRSYWSLWGLHEHLPHVTYVSAVATYIQHRPLSPIYEIYPGNTKGYQAFLGD